MQRRAFLGLVTAGAAGLAGCTVRAIPGGDPGTEQPTATACPALLDVDRRVCPGSTAGPLAVDRSSATVSGDQWSVTVTVSNRSDAPMGLNPYAWSVFRLDGDRWRHVAPDAYVEPWLELAPGDRYVWRLTAGTAGADDADQRVVLDLSPGTYAFAVPFHGSERVAAVATFERRG